MSRNHRKPTTRPAPRPARPNARPNARPVDTVVLAYLHPGMVSAYFMTSLMQSVLYDRGTAQRIVGSIEEWSSANVSAARNSAVERFLDGPGDWLLFIDSDMAWQVDALDRMFAVADADKMPIVGGLCFGARHGELFPTIYQIGEHDGQLMTSTVGDYPLDSVVGCAATGAAFLLIHRRVLTTMRDRQFNVAFPWFQETELSGQPAGEDLTFCLRAGQLGFPVYVNTAVKVGHHKSHLLTEELFLAQKEAASVDA